MFLYISKASCLLNLIAGSLLMNRETAPLKCIFLSFLFLLAADGNDSLEGSQSKPSLLVLKFGLLLTFANTILSFFGLVMTDFGFLACFAYSKVSVTIEVLKSPLWISLPRLRSLKMKLLGFLFGCVSVVTASLNVRTPPCFISGYTIEAEKVEVDLYSSLTCTGSCAIS